MILFAPNLGDPEEELLVSLHHKGFGKDDLCN
jgi:hypothetical protein